MQHLLLLKQEAKIARFVPSEAAIKRNRDRYYSVIRQARALGSLHPILEFLAECFAVSAEEIAKEGKALLGNSAEKKPKIRHEKILGIARGGEPFSIRQVIAEMPEVPRRSLARDLELLTKSKALRATGSNRARAYALGTEARAKSKAGKKKKRR